MFLILVIVFSMLTFIMIIAFSCLRTTTQDQEKETFMDNQDTLACDEHCKSMQRQLKSLIDYDPGQDINASISNLLLVGSPNQEDIRKLTHLRSELLGLGVNLLKNQQEFIIFFDKPNFMGRMYFLPVMDMYWKPETMTQAQKYHNRTNAALLMSNNDKQSTHITLGKFITDFSFHFNRHFSCIIPDNVNIEMIHLQRDNVPSDPFILRPGHHKSLRYYKSVLREFVVTKKKNEFTK